MTPEVVVIGGTAGLGRAIALAYVGRGARVGVGGRDAARAGGVASELGENAYGFAIDVADPDGIGDALRELGAVDRLVVTAILRDQNAVRGATTSRAPFGSRP